MGLLDQIIGRLGGQEPVERLAREEANFDDPQSPEFAHWNELVGAAPHCKPSTHPQEYHEHITPGVRGTDPLGTLGGGALGTLASRLLGSLTGGESADFDQLRQRVPGCTRPIRSRRARRRWPTWRTTCGGTTPRPSATPLPNSGARSRGSCRSCWGISSYS